MRRFWFQDSAPARSGNRELAVEDIEHKGARKNLTFLAARQLRGFGADAKAHEILNPYPPLPPHPPPPWQSFVLWPTAPGRLWNRSPTSLQSFALDCERLDTELLHREASPTLNSFGGLGFRV